MLIAGVQMPDDLLYLVDEQTWARLLPDGTALQGITALGILAAGEIHMCRPKSAGELLTQGRSMAVVELAKSIVSVKSPLSGQVLRVNPRLQDEPELVHRDPHGEGWLLQLAPSRLAEERPRLAEGAAAQPQMEQHAWRMQLGQ